MHISSKSNFLLILATAHLSLAAPLANSTIVPLNYPSDCICAGDYTPTLYTAAIQNAEKYGTVFGSNKCVYSSDLGVDVEQNSSLFSVALTTRTHLTIEKTCNFRTPPAILRQLLSLSSR